MHIYMQKRIKVESFESISQIVKSTRHENIENMSYAELVG